MFDVSCGGGARVLACASIGRGRASASWYVDSFDEKTRYASFLTRDLVPLIDRKYRTVASREGRAVMGISMGGYGAMRWALDQPGLFTVVVGLSPAFQQLTWNGVEALPFFLRPMLKRVFGKDNTANSLRRSDLYDSLLSDPTLAPRVPEVLVRCGTEDKYRLTEIASFFDRYLGALGVAHQVVGRQRLLDHCQEEILQPVEHVHLAEVQAAFTIDVDRLRG